MAVPAATSRDESRLLARRWSTHRPRCRRRQNGMACNGSRESACGCGSLVCPNVRSSGSGPSGSGDSSASASWCVCAGERRTVWAALLMRMSSGPGPLRRHPPARQPGPGREGRCRRFASGANHLGESARLVNRRTASRGNRVVMVAGAVASSRSAMYIPILARPPVSRARLPVRLVRASRFVTHGRAFRTAGGRTRRRS